jgi:hypothetical protein
MWIDTYRVSVVCRRCNAEHKPLSQCEEKQKDEVHRSLAPYIAAAGHSDETHDHHRKRSPPYTWVLSHVLFGRFMVCKPRNECNRDQQLHHQNSIHFPKTATVTTVQAMLLLFSTDITLCVFTLKILTLQPLVRKLTIQTEQSQQLTRECRMVSATDPHGR